MNLYVHKFAIVDRPSCDQNVLSSKYFEWLSIYNRNFICTISIFTFSAHAEVPYTHGNRAIITKLLIISLNIDDSKLVWIWIFGDRNWWNSQTFFFVHFRVNINV